jgi:hypothetical protein
MAIQSKIWHAEFRIYGQSNRNCSEAKQLGWNFFLHQYNWDPNEAIGKPIPIIICGREIGMELDIVWKILRNWSMVHNWERIGDGKYSAP